MELIIQIDDREKLPWKFPLWIKTEVAHLPTADYRLKGDTLAIERKSKEDLLGTISSGYDRFLREIERMADWCCKIIIVECDLISFYYTEVDGKVIDPDHQHYCLSPQFITRRIAELSLLGCNIIFAHDAGIASAIAYKILERRFHAIKNKSKTSSLPTRGSWLVDNQH